MTAGEIRQKYLEFFKSKAHVVVPSSSLVPENDATTLFTGSGMQPMIQYLLGQPHGQGTRITDSQKCFRAQDIEEVGDNRHTTFFEMLGNWSLGDYFKREQIPWMFDFLTGELGLDPKRIYVTCFRGLPEAGIPKDEESALIWKNLFAEKGIEATVADNAETQGMQGARIFYYNEKKNWWSRSGVPDNMPVGEPGGPDTEMFWDFGAELGLHEQSEWKDEVCHVNCDCGRFMEIGNNVFMEYLKTETGFEKLKQQNVDFGGGLERLAAAVQDDSDMFKIDLLWTLVKYVQDLSGKTYGEDKEVTRQMRIVADHLRASVFLVLDGVLPSNKDRGYVLRRLLRRSMVAMKKLGVEADWVPNAVAAVILTYKTAYPELSENAERISHTINEEKDKFSKTLEKGLKEFEKLLRYESSDFAASSAQGYGRPLKASTDETNSSESTSVSPVIPSEALRVDLSAGAVAKAEGSLTGDSDSSASSTKLDSARNDNQGGMPVITGTDAFNLYQTYGFPWELTRDLALEAGLHPDEEEFKAEFKKHQDLSRTASAGDFKGGLKNHSDIVVRYHTATHLLQKALRTVLGEDVWQKGSNITEERTRFDFTYPQKMTDEQKQKVEKLVNEWIARDLSVKREVIPLEEARKRGAIGLFGEKYADTVSVYQVFDPKTQEVVSLEFCGGPHVEHTGTIGKFRIAKEEAVSAGVRRIKGVIE